MRGGWVGCCVALALGTGVAIDAHAQQPAATEAMVAKAQDQYFAGQQLYAEKRFQDALVAFRESYSLVPSPNSRLYVARCLRELGQLVAAYDEYGDVLREAEAGAFGAGKYMQTHEAAATERVRLRYRLTFLRIRVPADVSGATLRVSNREIERAKWEREVVVLPGQVVTVRIEAPGHRAFEWRATGKAGETIDVPVVLAEDATQPSAAPPRASPSAPLSTLRALAIVSGGVGVAGVAVGGIFALQASSRFDTLNRECGGSCGPDRADDLDAGRREDAASIAGFTVGATGVALGVVLWILGAPPKSSARNAVGPIVAPRLSIETMGMGIVLGGAP